MNNAEILQIQQEEIFLSDQQNRKNVMKSGR